MSLWELIRGRNNMRRTRSGLPPTPSAREHGDAGERRIVLGPLGWLFCLLFVTAMVLIVDFGVVPPRLTLGSQAPTDIRARVDFNYDDFEHLHRQKRQARENAPPVYRRKSDWSDEILRELIAIDRIADQSADLGQLHANLAQLQARSASFQNYKELVEQMFLYKQDLKQKRKNHQPDIVGYIAGILRGLGGSLSSPGGVMGEKLLDELRQKGNGVARILIAEPGSDGELVYQTIAETKLTQSILLSIKDARDRLRYLIEISNIPDRLKHEINHYMSINLNQSNLTLDHDLTTQQAYQAQQAVVDFTRSVRAGALLVSKGDIVQDSTIRMLREEALAYKLSLPPMRYGFYLLGLAAFIAAMLAFCIVGLRRIQPSIFRRNRQLIMLALACLLVMVVSKMLMLREAPVQLAPVAIAALTASLAFSPSVALVVSFGLSILIGFTVGMNMPLALALMMGSMVAALPAKNLQGRGDLLRYGLAGGFAQAMTVIGLCLLKETGILSASTGGALESAGVPFPHLSEAVWAFVNPLGCAIVVLGALPLIEAAFGIVTNIRLLELSDQNQPALRKIQLEAPGTWAHTLQVAFLSEPAAEAIGANPRLVRAGVYYHDLGKTLKPEYFVENQMDADERHARLAPSVSALIITSHVKDGLVLAKEFGLPRQIVDFIPEHHGTQLVTFFYHSARRKAEQDEPNVHTGRRVQESFFRYPGPKPQSRETAIVMLADTIEAATRTLENPSAPRLEHFVHELIMHKLLDNQFDECGLTFKDLAIMEKVFVRVLLSRFHSRIKYPGQDQTGSLHKEPEKEKRAGTSSTNLPPPPKDEPRNKADDQDGSDEERGKDFDHQDTITLPRPMHNRQSGIKTPNQQSRNNGDGLPNNPAIQPG